MGSSDLGLQTMLLDGPPWWPHSQENIRIVFDGYDFNAGSWCDEETPEREHAGPKTGPSLGCHPKPQTIDLNPKS